MIETARIRSQFDIELQLGGGWFLTALTALNDHGLLVTEPLPPPAPPDAEVIVSAVEIIFEPGFDLGIDLLVAGFPFRVRASLALSDDGTELNVTTDVTGVELTLPFSAFDDLAGVPLLEKVPAEGANAAAMVLLANMDIRASEQSLEPLDDGDHVDRGDASQVMSFLPVGQDIALGIGAATFPRLANNTWHTELRADDGTHPLPDEDDPAGDWSSVTMTPLNGRVRLRLRGTVPLDSPIIDLVPDAEVTVTLDVVPKLVDGSMTFEIEVDANVDTGLLGDLFAFFLGGFAGFVVGLFVGGFAIPGATALGAVIALEIGEAVVEGNIERRVRAEIDGEPVLPILTCHTGLVHEALPLPDEDDFSLGPLDALPRSIPLVVDKPEPLTERALLVTAQFDEIHIDTDGLALAGPVVAEERFQPVPADLVGRTYDGDTLASLEYRLVDNTVVTIDADEAVDRMVDAELQPPLKLQPEPAEADLRIPAGRLVTSCLRVQAIRRKNTIVTELQFTPSVDFRVPDAVRLQDAGVIVVEGLQLIHPKNAKPYYRSFADSSLDNNLENKPTF